MMSASGFVIAHGGIANVDIDEKFFSPKKLIEPTARTTRATFPMTNPPLVRIDVFCMVTRYCNGRATRDDLEGP